MGKTAIEWTDEVLNVQRGCDAVSPGCAHCWAAATATRFSAPGEAFAGLAKRKALPGGGSLAVWTDKPVMLLPDKMLDVLSWRKPKRVFVNSVSDTFHADVPFEYIAALWAFMACASTVTFQIVTKRARRMREFFEWTTANGGRDHWLRCALNLCDALEHKETRWTKARETLLSRFKAPTARAELTRGTTLLALENVWLLVSTENQETYDERVAELLQCPAVVRGISAEPLLGPIEFGLGRWIRLPKPLPGYVPIVGEGAAALRAIVGPDFTIPAGVYRARTHHGGGLHIAGDDTGHSDMPLGPGEFELLPDIDWAIIGGESGAGCRVNDLRWTRDMLRQIETYNIARAVDGPGYCAPFLKQLGGAAVDAENGLVGRLYVVDPDAGRKPTVRLQDGHGGDEREFPADLQGRRHFPVPRLYRQPDPPVQVAHPMGQLGLL